MTLWAQPLACHPPCSLKVLTAGFPRTALLGVGLCVVEGCPLSLADRLTSVLSSSAKTQPHRTLQYRDWSSKLRFLKRTPLIATLGLAEANQDVGSLHANLFPLSSHQLGKFPLLSSKLAQILPVLGMFSLPLCRKLLACSVPVMVCLPPRAFPLPFL